MVEFAGSTVECHFRSLVSLNLVSKSEDFMIQWCESGDQRQQAAETQKKMQQVHAHMECQIMRAPQFTAKLVNTLFSLVAFRFSVRDVVRIREVGRWGMRTIPPAKSNKAPQSSPSLSPSLREEGGKTVDTSKRNGMGGRLKRRQISGLN